MKDIEKLEQNAEKRFNETRIGDATAKNNTEWELNHIKFWKDYTQTITVQRYRNTPIERKIFMGWNQQTQTEHDIRCTDHDCVLKVNRQYW